MNRKAIAAKLRALKPSLIERFKVKEIGLFGSLVRGEQTENSDIDVLVEFEDEADLFDLLGLSLDLENVLQRRVDVVPKRALRAELKESVLHDLVAL